MPVLCQPCVEGRTQSPRSAATLFRVRRLTGSVPLFWGQPDAPTPKGNDSANSMASILAGPGPSWT